MSDLSKRLRASVKFDAINGSSSERAICGKQMIEAALEIERLTYEIEVWKRDAERYRWLRAERFDDDLPTVQSTVVGCIGLTLDGTDLDAAIDAAMAQEKRDDRQ